MLASSASRSICCHVPGYSTWWRRRFKYWWCKAAFSPPPRSGQVSITGFTDSYHRLTSATGWSRQASWAVLGCTVLYRVLYARHARSTPKSTDNNVRFHSAGQHRLPTKLEGEWELGKQLMFRDIFRRKKKKVEEVHSKVRQNAQGCLGCPIFFLLLLPVLPSLSVCVWSFCLPFLFLVSCSYRHQESAVQGPARACVQGIVAGRRWSPPSLEWLKEACLPLNHPKLRLRLRVGSRCAGTWKVDWQAYHVTSPCKVPCIWVSLSGACIDWCPPLARPGICGFHLTTRFPLTSWLISAALRPVRFWVTDSKRGSRRLYCSGKHCRPRPRPPRPFILFYYSSRKVLQRRYLLLDLIPSFFPSVRLCLATVAFTVVELGNRRTLPFSPPKLPHFSLRFALFTQSAQYFLLEETLYFFCVQTDLLAALPQASKQSSVCVIRVTLRKSRWIYAVRLATKRSDPCDPPRPGTILIEHDQPR